MDVTTIKPGVDFVKTIESELSSCDFLVAMIGQQWLTSRLKSPKDLVRREIETALDQGVTVIPVLVQGANMPRSQDLPDELAKLAQTQALELSDTRWDYDVRRLKKRLGISFADRAKRCLGFLSLIIACAIVILGAINYYPAINAVLSAALTPKVVSSPPTDSEAAAVRSATPTLTSTTTPTPTPTPTPTITPTISCADIAIVALELRSAAGRRTETVRTSEVLTTTVSSFTLHPQTEPESLPRTCEFEWTVGPDVDGARYEEIILSSNQGKSVAGGVETLLETVKCQVVLNVAPMDAFEAGVAGNPVAFQIVVTPCPYGEP
jgi:hypothetical protein